jgi:hypothetical protein
MYTLQCARVFRQESRRLDAQDSSSNKIILQVLFAFILDNQPVSTVQVAAVL